MKTTLLFIFVLLTIPLALAESGCFLSKDSSFYCQTIDKEQAAEECQNKQCTLETSFIENKDCTKENFPECEQILCKSSCQNDFLGNCLSGPIPDDNKEEWCTPGCCAYLANEELKCLSQHRKGICEAQARNKNEPEFYYQPLEKQQCETICTTEIGTIQDLEENDFLIYKVQSSKTISNNSTPSQPITEKTKTTSKTTTTSAAEKKESSSNNSIWLLVIIILAGISYYIYTQQQKHQSPTEEVHLTPLESLSLTSPKTSPLQFNFKTTPQSEALKHLHTTKVKEHERDDFFQSFGNFATKAQYEGSHLKTLKNIVELYDRKKLSIPSNLSPKEKKALDLLQDLVSKTKQQQAPPSPPPILNQTKSQPELSPFQKKKKKELDDVLNALRQISKNS